MNDIVIAKNAIFKSPINQIFKAPELSSLVYKP